MPANRQALLKIIAIGLAALFLLDKVVITPFFDAWKEQGERVTALREKVQRGRGLIEREKNLRARWDEMLRTDLNEDISVAESDVYKAIGRWTRDSHVNFTGLDPNWKVHDTGYDTYELRATAVGDQASLGRLIYEIESDPLPARIEDCELTARDAKGVQLGLSMKFSFVSINGTSATTGNRK